MAGRLYIPAFEPETLLNHLHGDTSMHTSPNMAPRQAVSIIRQASPGHRLSSAFWGFTPPWLKVLDHAQHCARAETLRSRPMFAEALASQRCLVPVGGFYVWKPAPRMKQPFLITRHDRGPLLLAGIWTRYPTSESQYHDSMALITVPAPPFLASLTDRLPTIIAPDRATEWLDSEASGEHAETLLSSSPAELLGAFPVSRQVNDPTCQEWSCAYPTGPMFCQHHVQER
ncbi:SOS response-associated peptidase [Aidingimonas halophila]|uniref:Abasic site processing protein n=1 Tax=Aidingimonas halophila TaxID=574349 RepID=A0A1H2VUR3_9GAMM|nr:SOS response-associated peptidase [Aidingimonas halophila]GHC24819.1 hypothetical protein GCM10008094_14980 [Aidingimonas halophila]SDW71987.1 Putative SOS response-associated peptidase YedK [Aidingimonas halophila]